MATDYNTNKETQYGYVLISEKNKRLYSHRNGEDGVCMSLHSATVFTTEQQAREKRDQLYNDKKMFFDVKRIVIQYTLCNF